MAEMDYSTVLPTEAPKEVLEYLMDVKAFRNEFLIYRAKYYYDPLTGLKEKGVEIKCSACGESGIATYIPANGCGRAYASAPFGFAHPETKESLISGMETICPFCGAEVRAKHIGEIHSGYNLREEKWCMTVGRYEDKLVLYGWLCQRQINKNAEKRYVVLPYEAYVVEKRSIIRLMGYKKCLSAISLFGHWEQRKRYYDSWGDCTLICPWDPEILVGSTAENSKLDLYFDASRAERTTCAPVSYLKVWQKHPQLENLLVQGAGKVIISAINDERNRYGYVGNTLKLEQINWKERRPAQMLGLNKDEFRACCKGKWNAGELKLYKKVRDVEKLDPIEDMKILRSIKYAEELVGQEKRRGGASVMRCARYLARQNGLGDKNSSPSMSVAHLLDYWKMADECGYNLNESGVRFPKDLRREHDRVMKEHNALREKLAAEKKAAEIKSRENGFKAAYKRLQAYAWEKNGIMIRPCENENELIREGKTLLHCVSAYAQKIADGKTAIFFIRKTDKPDTPWYTLELNEKDLMVRQNRGKQNCGKTKAVDEFEKKWLEWLVTQKKAGRLGKKSKTKESKTA